MRQAIQGLRDAGAHSQSLLKEMSVHITSHLWIHGTTSFLDLYILQGKVAILFLSGRASC